MEAEQRYRYQLLRQPRWVILTLAWYGWYVASCALTAAMIWSPMALLTLGFIATLVDPIGAHEFLRGLLLDATQEEVVALGTSVRNLWVLLCFMGTIAKLGWSDPDSPLDREVRRQMREDHHRPQGM